MRESSAADSGKRSVLKSYAVVAGLGGFVFGSPWFALCWDQDSLVHGIDFVGQRNESFAVGDDQDGHLAFHGLECFTYLQFASHIDLACGFVEDEDFGFAKDSASQGDALALSAAEFLSTLSDICVVAIGEGLSDEIVSVGKSCGDFYFFACRLWGSVLNIFKDGAVEQFSALADERDSLTYVVQSEFSQVGIIEFDGSGDRVVVAAEELDQG